MKRLLLLASLLLSGCVAFSPETRSQAYLASLTDGATQIRREQKVGERSVILAAYGACFLPAPVQVELAKVMKHRRAHGQWPELNELASAGERWRISRQRGDLLLLTQEAGEQKGISEVFVAPDGFIGLDAAYRKIFDQFDALYVAIARPRGSATPPIIVPHGP